MLTVLSGTAHTSLPSKGVCTKGKPARRPSAIVAPSSVALLANEPAQPATTMLISPRRSLIRFARRADDGDVDRFLVVGQRVTIVDDQHAQRLVPDRQAHAPTDSGERRLRLPRCALTPLS
jgi:hypothetical protein